MSTSIEATSQNIASISANPVTSSVSKMQGETQIYTKRGSAKRNPDHFMEEAIGAIKTLCQHEPPIASHESNSSVSSDSAHTLGMFIAARLREMMPDQRKQCENEILKLFSQF